jgi:hypothetical protein
MSAQFNTHSHPTNTVQTTTETQIHHRDETLQLMEELQKRQRPFEKLRLAQAQEAKYRGDTQLVEGLLETLDTIALTETELGIIPPTDRTILKKSLHQALSGSHASTPVEAPSVDTTTILQQLQTTTPPQNTLLEDGQYLNNLGNIIATKLAEQLNHKQLALHAFGFNQLGEEKLILCKYLQQLLDEVVKLKAENEALKTNLDSFKPAGLGLFTKSK